MINKRKILYVAILLVLTLTIILSHSNNLSITMNTEINKKITFISQKNIYFGHQSVGENIITGIKKIISDNNQNEIVIKTYNNNDSLGRNYFLHSNIGKNGNPQTKFDEFTSVVSILAGKNLNIAMMKLCFVDITKNTNIKDVFNSYSTIIDSLKHRYPEIKFIHFTVPLKSKPSWINYIKDKIKGNNNYDPKDNLARNRYNELVLSKYPKDDIFDLAGAESTYPNGKRESELVDGKPCYILIKDYTTDGGHLNDLGRQIISEKLIQKLYEIIKSSNMELSYKPITSGVDGSPK
jgi:hypothetical protein